jgi:hypothetical protein
MIARLREDFKGSYRVKFMNFKFMNLSFKFMNIMSSYRDEIHEFKSLHSRISILNS